MRPPPTASAEVGAGQAGRRCVPGQRVAHPAARQDRSLYQPFARTDAGLADHGAPLPPRWRPWKRAVLAPTATAPLSSARTLCAHEETFGLPATRRLALCDVPHIASPRRCPKWQARKPCCQSIDNGRPVMATTTFAFARFSAGNMGRAWLVTLALAGAVAVASPAAADPTGIAVVE